MGKKREVPAGIFKSQCLALLDQVAESGLEIVITKRGRPVAKLSPLAEAPSLRGSVVWEGDIISPLDDEWDAD